MNDGDEYFVCGVWTFVSCILKSIFGVLLVIPALWWLFGEFFGWWSVYLYDRDYVVVGLSAIAGAYLIVNGGIAALFTKANKMEQLFGNDKKKEWDKIGIGKSFKVFEDGSIRTFREEDEIYAKAIGNQTYYKTDLYYLVPNPYYGEDSERGKAKYKCNNSHWDIYVIF